MDAIVQNIAYLGKVMCINYKQHFAKFEVQFIKKLSNTEAELKKNVAYKKKVQQF